MSGLILLSLFLLISLSRGVSMYPHTLLATDLACTSTTDCKRHYNDSWCASSGILCIHHTCKRIPEYPCRTTQECVEEQHKCIDRQCSTNEECSNDIYCDGEEICTNGRCTTDPERPACINIGGKCDEASRTCTLSEVRLAWRAALRAEVISSESTDIKATGLTGNEQISQDAVGVTSLAIIGFITGLLALFTLTVIIAKALSGHLSYHY